MGQITNTTDSLPRSATFSGTVSCAANSKLVTGSSTDFLSLRVGDYLFDTANTELRKIESIQSATELHLRVGFTNALSGATVKSVKSNAKQISGYADGGEVTITKADTDETVAITDGTSYNPSARSNGVVDAFLVTAGSGVDFNYDIQDW